MGAGKYTHAGGGIAGNCAWLTNACLHTVTALSRETVKRNTDLKSFRNTTKTRETPDSEIFQKLRNTRKNKETHRETQRNRRKNLRKPRENLGKPRKT